MSDVESYVKSLIARQILAADVTVEEARQTLIEDRQRAHRAAVYLDTALRRQRDLKLYFQEHFE